MEILHDPCQLGVPSGVSKVISKAMVRLVQTMDLSCTDTNTISNGPKWDSTWPTSPRSSIGCVQNDSELTVRSGKPCTYLESRLALSPNESKRVCIWASSPRCTTSSVFKMISEPTVRLAQTVHLSYIETNTVSKRNETNFHLSLVTQAHHPVHPKQFPSLWYVWRKPGTYHAPKLTVSSKGPKGDSTWPTSPRSSIGCVQNDFMRLWYVRRKQCTYHESRLALYPNRPKWAFIWASSPRSTIQCVQNDFWGYGTSGANRVSILHRD
jgi:hypothetical protein